MNPNENPYFAFASMMQGAGQTNAPYYIGKVVTAEPLTVQVGDIRIGRECMKISTLLLSGYTRKITIPETGATGITGSTGRNRDDRFDFENHTHTVNRVGLPSADLILTDTLAEGDEVLLLNSADQQQFILICKLA